MSLNPGIGKALRRYFIAGLLVWLPILATYFVVHFLVKLLDGTLALLPEKYHPTALTGYDIPGMGVLLSLAIMLLTGLLVTNFIGHRLIILWEKILSRIPLVRSIHSAAKQVASAILHPSGNAFRKVLLIQYPRQGIWSMAFQTSGELSCAGMDKKVITAFVPTTPNPTSGFMMFIPIDETIEVNISIEEALRMVISIGVIIPEHLKQSITG